MPTKAVGLATIMYVASAMSDATHRRFELALNAIKQTVLEKDGKISNLVE